jgi:outer membrane protein OmpA-like peptidoglycan-associated protein
MVELSTSMSEPTPIEPLNGVILGKTPGATAKTYYLSADLKAGLLMYQAENSGRGGSIRRNMSLALLNDEMKPVDTRWRDGVGDTADVIVGAFPIDSSRRAVLRLKVEGDELGDFCLLLGGTALPALKPASCPPRAGPAASTNLDEFSTSVFKPSDANAGMAAGKLPGGTEALKAYFFSVDLKAGSLLTQRELTTQTSARRDISFTLYDSNLKKMDSFWTQGAYKKDQATRSIDIDSSGRYFIKLEIRGEETGNFCLLLGGTALPTSTVEACPEKAAAAAPAPSVQPPAHAYKAYAAIVPLSPAPKPIEVITSKCEERLRVGSDFLFDFDRADIRPEAGEALSEVKQRIEAVRRRVIIEGHTDGKGSDGYNQTLSERRAAAVRVALIERGASESLLFTHGFGKSRPIAPNDQPDGSDDPVGRQKNRRVEVVINTCS